MRQHPDPFSRKFAALAFGKIVDKCVLEPLLEALKSEEIAYMAGFPGTVYRN